MNCLDHETHPLVVLLTTWQPPQVVAALGSGINVSALDAMPYAEAVAREALRLAPPATDITRLTLVDLEVHSQQPVCSRMQADRCHCAFVTTAAAVASVVHHCQHFLSAHITHTRIHTHTHASSTQATHTRTHTTQTPPPRRLVDALSRLAQFCFCHFCLVNC